MKKSTFSTLLALLLSLNFFGQKIKSIEPIGGLPSKKIDFCGAIKYKEQPIKKCLDLNHFIEDENGSKIHNPTEEFEDRFGNIYCNYITNHLQKESRVRRQAGDFSVLVPTALGNEIKDIITQVFADLSELIVTHPNPCRNYPLSIVIRRSNALPNDVAAVGSSYYSRSGIELESKAWRAINGTLNSTLGEDFIGEITLNTNQLTNFYTGFPTDNNNDGIMDQVEAREKLNLYQIILHEALHILGFSSGITRNNSGDYQIIKPKKLDFLLHSEGQNFINGFLEMSHSTNTNFNSTHFETECSVTLEGIDSDYKMYTPSIYSPGSSFTHFALDSCEPNPEFRVMNFSIENGQFTKISQDEINVLKNLGYTTTTTYGTSNLISNGFPNPFYQQNPSFLKLANITHDDNNNGCNADYLSGNPPQNQIPVLDCSTSNTYTITNDFLLANDIINDFQEIEHVETSVGHINITSSGLTLTTDSFGTNVRIKYNTKNQEGYISNTAYFYVFIKPCDNFGNNNFNCTNSTNNCNLICNPHLVPSSEYEDTAEITMSNNSPHNNAIPGWYPYNNFLIYNRNNPFGGGTLPDRGLFRLQRRHGNEKNGAAMTQVNLQDNTNYILSIFNKATNTHQRLQVDLDILDEEYYILNNDDALAINIFESGQQSVTNWEQNIKSFSTGDNNPYNILVVKKEETSGTTLVDDIQLIEDRLNTENIQAEYFNVCNETYTIGADLCEEIFGVNYSWYDVTDSSNEIRLTNGYTDLISDEFEPVGNGSQLETSLLTETRKLELRRTFNNRSNTVTIATNDANASIQVTLNCEDNPCSFPKTYDGFDTLGNKQHPFNIATDSENNLIVSGRKSTPNMTFEGQNLTYNNFVAKYTQEGCLLWVKEVSGSAINLYLDSNDNILIASASVYPNWYLSKFTSTGNLIWEIELPDGYHRSFNLDPDDNFFAYKNKNIIKVDSNGNIEGINTNLPDDLWAISSPFLINNNNQEAYIKIFMSFGNTAFNFAGNTISPPNFPPNFATSYLLKYNIVGNTLVPDSFINVGHGKLFYNNNTNHLVLFDVNDDKVKIYDNNLNLILDTPKPHGRNFFNEKKDRLIIFNQTDETIHTLIDDGTFTTFDTVNLSLNGAGTSYSKLVQSDNELIYLAGTKPPYYEHYISKIDPNTGQSLSKNALKEKVAIIGKNKIKEKVLQAVIYPNPTKSSVTISSEKEIKEIKILSKIGLQLISNKKILNTEVIVNLENLENLTTDIYIVKVFFKDGTIEEQKIIKE